MKIILCLGISALVSQVFAKPPHSEPNPSPEVEIHSHPASPFSYKRADGPGDRAQSNYIGPHSKLSGCPNCLSTGFCGKISSISGFSGSEAPPLDDCEGIRKWLSDHNNSGYWRVRMDRLHSIPWVPLITVGSCTVVVGDDMSEGERNALIIGTKDVWRVMEAAIWGHEKDGTVGVTGWWEYCSATTYWSDNLAWWNTRFKVMVKSQVP